MVKIENRFEIGQIVYLKTDPDQLARIVYGIVIYEKNRLIYRVALAEMTSKHYEFEMSDRPDLGLSELN